MELEGSAASLPCWNHDLVAGDRQEPRGVPIHLGIELALHAAREEPGPSTHPAAGGNELWQGHGPRDLVEQRVHCRERWRQAKDAGCADEGAEP